MLSEAGRASQVQLAVGVFAMKKTLTPFDACVVLSFFPLSIVLVWVLENVFLLD